mmetsp:Transcript_5625/g.13041  ORF Transcript_5625/g.13041 Transcript_5625/m.13041 type:complete len:277 (+) Transcript_5625:362-1192(+)
MPQLLLPQPPSSDERPTGTNHTDNQKKHPTTQTEKRKNNKKTFFSWYCGWKDELGPFFEELVPEKDSLILVPGIGNDVAIRDMFDDGGYQKLMAFDYAPQGVECAKAMFGKERLQTITNNVYGEATTSDGDNQNGNDNDNDNDNLGQNKEVFRVCDARDLSTEYRDNLFDAVLDKGTFDSIYLSGGKDKEQARVNLSMAISEMKRVVKDNGIVFSVTAACVDAVQAAFENDGDWKQLRDGSMHITEDGYASNNVDATMLVWQLKRGTATKTETTDE